MKCDTCMLDVSVSKAFPSFSLFFFFLIAYFKLYDWFLMRACLLVWMYLTAATVSQFVLLDYIFMWSSIFFKCQLWLAFAVSCWRNVLAVSEWHKNFVLKDANNYCCRLFNIPSPALPATSHVCVLIWDFAVMEGGIKHAVSEFFILTDENTLMIRMVWL